MPTATEQARADAPTPHTPQPLYQLLVLAHLLSAHVRASVATDAARALCNDGM
ncbi:hypothetical protein AB0M32_31450 [Streptomyces sp. NPDC051985]|uniref:hypothetical protein n=1 Tax=Streptomyces sp. NPDC051985 TaxID=3155807 RepID=UPI00344733A3